MFDKGLLKDDQEWSQCLEGAALMSFRRQLHVLFVVILVECAPPHPEDL